MGRPGDPCRAMHVQPDVPGRPQMWLTSVESHSDADGLFARPLMLGELSLRLCGRSDRVIRAGEDDEE